MDHDDQQGGVQRFVNKIYAWGGGGISPAEGHRPAFTANHPAVTGRTRRNQAGAGAMAAQPGHPAAVTGCIRGDYADPGPYGDPAR